VDEFDVGIAAHAAESGGALDGLVADGIELSKQGGSCDFAHRADDSGNAVARAVSTLRGLVLGSFDSGHTATGGMVWQISALEASAISIAASSGDGLSGCNLIWITSQEIRANPVQDGEALCG
jgi:hypothetical protein